MAQGSKASTPDRQARRMAIENAADYVGGNRALADLLSCGERAVRSWRGGEREISNKLLCEVAAVLEVHAAKCRTGAARARELAGEAHLNIDAAQAPAPDRLARFKALPGNLQLRVAKRELELEAAEREAADA